MTPRTSVSSSTGSWIVAATLLFGIASSCLPVAAAAQSSAARESSIEMISVLARDRTMPSLERTVSINLKDVHLAHALEKIGAEADLHLTYAKRLLPRDVRITLQAEEISVAEAVARVLDGTDLDLMVAPNGQAVLVRKPEPEKAPEPIEEEREIVGTIAGRVTDTASGVGLDGVSVLIEGTSLGALSGQAGRFRIINVPAGMHTVVAQRLGYTEARQSVTVRDGQEASVEFSLEVSAVALDEVVVTGSIIETRTRELPSPITVMTQAEIEKKGVSRLDELLRGEVPGLISFDTGYGWYNLISVRGANALSRSYVKIYIDGVEVSNPGFLSDINPNIIERVEMVRGPQASTLYGSEASNGVLQIFTKKGNATGLDRPRIEAMASMGYINSEFASDDPALLAETAVTVSGGLQGFSYNAAASYKHNGNWMSEGATNVRSVAGGMRAVQGNFTFDASMRYFRSVLWQPRSPVLAQYDYYDGAPLNRQIDRRQQGMALKVGWQPFENWSHELIVGSDRQKFSNVNITPRFRTPSDSLHEMALDQDSEKRTIRYNTSVAIELSEALGIDLLAGWDQTKEIEQDGSVDGLPDIYGSFTSANATSVLVTRGLIRNSGYFTQGKLSIDDALFVTAGVRVESNSNIGGDGRATAPRVGIAYARSFGVVDAKVRTSWGKSLNAPTRDQSLGRQTATSVILPNPGIKVEEQTGWDAGLDLYGEGWSFSASYYDQTAAELIDFIYIDATGVPAIYQYQNVGTVDNHGVELDGSLHLGPVSLRGTMAFTTSLIEELGESYTGGLTVGDRVYRIPDRSASLSATWNVLRGSVTMDVQHTGSWIELNLDEYYGFAYGGNPYRGSLNAYYEPYEGFTKVNLRVEQSLSNNFSGFLRLDNLTDNQWTGPNNGTATWGFTPVLGFRFTY